MHIVSTIIPIFLIVILGWFIHRRGFIPNDFLGPANRLVYYVAIPAMIFQSISKSTFGVWFNPLMIMMTLTAATLIYLAAWLSCRMFHLERSLCGSFIQSSGHGNLGYIGLAVAFYFLGDTGLAHASVVAGFLMILQNLLSIMALQAFAPRTSQKVDVNVFVRKMLGNPVILAVLAGMLLSFFSLPVPLIFQRSLSILSGLALPTALLLIGASISIERIKAHRFAVIGAVSFKLLALPGLGWLFYALCGFKPDVFIPGLILLASPTATISYVMSKEMNSDSDLAVATISASTLASAGTFMLWLKLATG
jgi:predicted permease